MVKIFMPTSKYIREFKYVVFISILLVLITIPNKAFAQDIVKEINSLPYAEDFNITNTNNYFYKLNIKPGTLIDAKLTFGKISTIKNRKETVDLSDPLFLKSAPTSISFYAGNNNSIYGNLTYDSDSLDGNYYATDVFRIFKWAWSKETLKPLNIKYLTAALHSKDYYVIINATNIVKSDVFLDTTIPAKLIINTYDYSDYNNIDAGYFDADITELKPGTFTGYLFYQPQNDETKLSSVEGGDDKDYYKVKVSKGDVIKLSVKSPDEYLISTEVTNIDCQNCNNKKPSSSQTIEGIAGNDGFVFIFVRSLNDNVKNKAVVGYSLIVEKNPGLVSALLKKLTIDKCKMPSFFRWIFKINCNLKNIYDLNAENSTNISDEFNENVSSSAKSLAELLSKPNYELLKASSEPNPEIYRDSYCKFKYDSDDSNIPEKAQEVYDWSKNWSPRIYPENYIECTAFVHMAYNMAGKSFEDDSLGDPVNWPKRTDLFNVYENGKSEIAPEVGDIMIWSATSGNPHGHVGVVSGIANNTVYVNQANTPELISRFRFEKTNSIIKLKDSRWLPKYWLRLNENY